jgi:hypothetical protein
MEIPADVRLKAIKAINREVRRIKFELYFENARLRGLKFLFQAVARLSKIIRYLDSRLRDLVR